MENADTLSDNFYATLSPELLRKEFNKTISERRELEEFVRNQNGKADADLIKYNEKLRNKLRAIELAFASLFQDYGIEYKSKKQLKNAIQDLLVKSNQKSAAPRRLTKQLRSSIYSYDLDENDFYRGILQVERNIQASKKRPASGGKK